MSSPFLGLRTVGIIVPDIALGKEWYSKAFNTQPYFDEPFYVGYNIGGYELGLQPGGALKTDARNVVAYWGVEDVEKEYQRLLALGAESHGKPQDVGGDIIVASVRDPWGNIIGLIYNPGFGKS
jgi:predicted enzyme related to lactoylglutathione lyase